MNAQQIRNELLNSIKIMINSAIEKLGFSYHVLGKVTADLGSGLYTVLINGESYDIKAKIGNSYLVDDICWILIINGNFSQKVIDFKVP